MYANRKLLNGSKIIEIIFVFIIVQVKVCRKPLLVSPVYNVCVRLILTNKILIFNILLTFQTMINDAKLSL